MDISPSEPSRPATTWLVSVPVTTESLLLTADTREKYKAAVRAIIDIPSRTEKRWAMFPPSTSSPSPWREWQHASPFVRQPVLIGHCFWQAAPAYWGVVALMVDVHE